MTLFALLDSILLFVISFRSSFVTGSFVCLKEVLSFSVSLSVSLLSLCLFSLSLSVSHFFHQFHFIYLLACQVPRYSLLCYTLAIAFLLSIYNFAAFSCKIFFSSILPVHGFFLLLVSVKLF